MGRSRYLSIHSTRTASFYDADGIALDSRGFHVCDYAAANRTYAGYISSSSSGDLRLIQLMPTLSLPQGLEVSFLFNIADYGDLMAVTQERGNEWQEWDH